MSTELAVAGFHHLHAGHCESGVTASLYQDRGFTLSEPMVFGVGGGLFFGHFSFVRVMGHPLTTFRSFPGSIFRHASKRLGVRFARETFRDPARGMGRLDALLAQGKRVGLQVNIFWLPYIPRPMRIHFNGHNLLVLERRGDEYVVSDPVMECLFTCPADAMKRARFSGGHPLLPRGLLYYPEAVPERADLDRAVRAGLAEVCDRMLRIPLLPFMGIKGIRHLAAKLPTWAPKHGEEQAREWAAGLVRVQEEIGTGGAGFRFLFAAFLQEAGDTLGWDALAALSPKATAVGDRWRAFALQASRMARGKPDAGWEAMGAMLRDLADQEEALFRELDGVRRG